MPNAAALLADRAAGAPAPRDLSRRCVARALRGAPQPKPQNASTRAVEAGGVDLCKTAEVVTPPTWVMAADFVDVYFGPGGEGRSQRRVRLCENSKDPTTL